MADIQVSGTRKAAIALLAIGDDASAALLKFFQEDEIERIMREIADMGTVPSDLNDQVLGELRQSTAVSAQTTAGGVEHARRLLAKSLGPDQSRRILDRVLHSSRARAGFAALEKADPSQIAKFLQAEHPQTAALVLAHLTPPAAAQLLGQFSEENRADVMLRMASLGEIPPDVVAHVSGVIEQRLKGFAKPQKEQRGGIRAVAELFNRLDKSMSRMSLEKVEAIDPDTAVAIRNLMFVFDDLARANDQGIRELINQVDKKALTIALKGAGPAVRDRFFANMSKRAGDLLREEMEAIGSVKLKDVERSQQEVVAIARKLEEEGTLSTSDGAGEGYVA